jgi:LAS superfamily LD-carboxypeptidase LdcB
MKELLCGNILEDQSEEIQANLAELLEKMNKVRTARNQPMNITSGLRSKEHHIQVYKDLAKQRGQVFDISKVPMGSAHLKGAAVDISDPNGDLYQWTQDNTELMEEIGLWMEIKDDQHRVHYQIFPPKSGNRFFHP